MAARAISKRGLEFIKGYESFVPYVYDDLLPPVRGKYREWDGGAVRGTLTIGYGHTNAATHPLKIKRGLRISEAQAEEVLAADLHDVERDVNRLVKVPITQGQFDALVSFAFNCGAGALANLIRPLNAGNPNGTRAKFDLYIRSKGKVLKGLVRRRNGEQEMWDAIDPELPPKDHLQETPKEVQIDRPLPEVPPAAEKPMTQSKTIWGGILAWVGGVSGSIIGAFEYIATPWGFAALVFIVAVISIGLWMVIKGRLDVQKVVRHLSAEVEEAEAA